MVDEYRRFKLDERRSTRLELLRTHRYSLAIDGSLPMALFL